MVKISKLKIKIIQERGMEKKKKHFAGAGACQGCYQIQCNIIY
jgi:hypothetical protein